MRRVGLTIVAVFIARRSRSGLRRWELNARRWRSVIRHSARQRELRILGSLLSKKSGDPIKSSYPKLFERGRCASRGRDIRENTEGG